MLSCYTGLFYCEKQKTHLTGVRNCHFLFSLSLLKSLRYGWVVWVLKAGLSKRMKCICEGKQSRFVSPRYWIRACIGSHWGKISKSDSHSLNSPSLCKRWSWFVCLLPSPHPGPTQPFSCLTEVSFLLPPSFNLDQFTWLWSWGWWEGVSGLFTTKKESTQQRLVLSSGSTASWPKLWLGLSCISTATRCHNNNHKQRKQMGMLIAQQVTVVDAFQKQTHIFCSWRRLSGNVSPPIIILAAHKNGGSAWRD